MIFVNESHLGGLYLSDEYIDHERCETCGDSDWCMQFEDVREAVERLIVEWSISDLEELFGVKITLTIEEVEE